MRERGPEARVAPGESRNKDLPAPYERLIGRYALCGPFARGGMATVHLARQLSDEGFSRVVAVKRLHAHVAESQESLAMFLDEARLASRIRHSNVVPTLDVVSRDGELLIVMEYILGESLSSLIRQGRNVEEVVPVGVAVRIVIDALHGLHAAHLAKDQHGAPLGIVHRDVSPQNILIGVDGVARIVDFGIAKASGRLQTTQNNKLKGKLAYMAPEQLQRSGELDARVDVYATSIVLWELLTNERLFRGEDEIETFKKALDYDVPAPHTINPALTEELSQAVMHGLRRARDERPHSALDLASELENLNIAVSSSRVAAWVKTTAASSLEQAQERLSALEQAPALDLEALMGPMGSWSETTVRNLVEKARAEADAATDVIDSPPRALPTRAEEAGASEAQSSEGTNTATITLSRPIAVETGAGRRKRLVPALLLSALAFGAVLYGLNREPVEGESGASAAGRGPGEPQAKAEPSSAEPRGASAPSAAGKISEPIKEDGQRLPADQGASATKQPQRDPAAVADPKATVVASPQPAAQKVTKAVSPAPRPAMKSTPRTKPAPADDCRNPFTTDKDGVRVPKVHCL